MFGGFCMGDTNFDREARRYKAVLERESMKRLFLVAAIMAIASFAAVPVILKAEPEAVTVKLCVIAVLYGVASGAFSWFFVQLLKKKGRESEQWLFKMLYLMLHTCVLTYCSFVLWKATGTLFLYYLTVVLNCCIVVYRGTEYLVVALIELLLPALLAMEKTASAGTLAGMVLLQVLAIGIVLEIGYYFRKETLYRLKYRSEAKNAGVDPLTGLENRRGMLRRVESVWPFCERMKQNVAVMVIDIDHFKKYNDRFGHPAGDACLKSVAEVIRGTVRRKTDLSARIGGEEFLVFLYGMEEESVYRLAERIRQGVASLRIPHAEGAKYRYVTVSVGVASERCSRDLSFGGLYRRADRELYYAKNTGRNKVSLQKEGNLSLQDINTGR